MALAAAFGLSAVLRAQLESADLDRLRPYGPSWEHTQRPATALDGERQQALADALARARQQFQGRGPALARDFLARTDHTISNEAYWFVLGALADVDAALILIRALPNPPPQTTGFLSRDRGEIGIALETMLLAPAVAENQKVAEALIRVIEERTPRSGPPDIEVALLGKCRSEFARAVLNRLLADPSAQVRGFAALALGQIPADGQAPEISPEGLVAMLERDADPQARIQAATALGRLGGQALVALDRAADREATPQVVDAIVMALHHAGSPITDPARCRRILERSWEVPAVSACFNRWLAAADQADVIQAATTGPPVLRLLAIRALAQPGPRREIVQRQPARSPAIDPALRQRLLASLSDVLSMPASSVGPLVPYTAQQALWDVSGHDLVAALPHVDAIKPIAARLAAANVLARNDPAAYAAARRPRQTLPAVVVLVIGLVLAAVPLTRAAGVCLAVSAAAWAVWTMGATGVRNLPPPSLMLLTVPAISLLAAGGVAAASTWAQSRWGNSRVTRIALAAATIVAAGFVAFVIALWSRGSGIFPVDGEGFAMIFEPIATALFATIWAALLLALLWLGRSLSREFLRRS